MRRLLPFLLLSLTVPCGLCQQSSPPLDEREKRRILEQLLELKACREEARTYRDYVSREAAQDAREKANGERALELERQATALAEKERDLAIQKADLYEQMYKSLVKRPGLGCRILRALTAGIVACR